jgi:hypothetical protein
MAHEGSVAEEWLMATLSGDADILSRAPGGVYNRVKPQRRTPQGQLQTEKEVYVVFAPQTPQGTDYSGLSGECRMAELVYQVKAVGEARQREQVAAAAAWIDVLLRSGEQVAVDKPLISCRRIGSLDDFEMGDGVIRYYLLGGFYRIHISGGG